jgi:hypothetical protein
MTLVTRPTADGGTLVEGTDARGTDGITVLYSEKWNAVVAMREHKIDESEFKDVVDQIFGPLMEKADEIRNRRNKNVDLTRVVITEGTEGVEEVAVDLAGDSQGTALKLLDEGKADLLRWVNGQLVAVL